MPVTPLSAIALPAVKTLEDCSDFEKTVAPFLYQFYELPQRLLDIKSLDSLKDAYIGTNPVISAFSFSLVIAVATFVVSSYHKNYSQIDRLWSILPAIYNIHYWYWGSLNGIRSSRLDSVAIFSACWSARLTFNYWRKGGYQRGSEDYRWAIIKGYVNDVIWVIFNIVFISFMQSVLLAMVTTPTYILLLTSKLSPETSGSDAVFPQILGALLAISLFADNQQWAFQQAKKEYQKTAKVPLGHDAKELDRGFVTTGLWAYSRHPNFAAEQSIWVALYQWACFDTGSLINWTGIGALSYLLVFQGSTPITEWITSKKYPEYKQYQARVGRFVPKLGGSTWQQYLDEKEKGVATKGNDGAGKKKETKKGR